MSLKTWQKNQLILQIFIMYFPPYLTKYPTEKNCYKNIKYKKGSKKEEKMSNFRFNNKKRIGKIPWKFVLRKEEKTLLLTFSINFVFSKRQFLFKLFNLEGKPNQKFGVLQIITFQVLFSVSLRVGNCKKRKQKIM